MSTLSATKRSSRFDVIASALLGPVSVLSMLYLSAVFGSLFGQAWAIALFWSLMMLVAGSTTVALAGALPLPRLTHQSHLLDRLTWLGRYGTGAFLLCVSTFLGGMAGTAVPAGNAQQAASALIQLVATVGLVAIQIAIVMFLAWLVTDVHRLGVERRRAGIARSVTYIAGRRIARACDHPAVTRWLDALTSPFLFTFAAVTAATLILLQTRG